MTYGELLEKVVEENADEKGVVRGKVVMTIFQISKAAAENGLDTEVDGALVASASGTLQP